MLSSNEEDASSALDSSANELPPIDIRGLPCAKTSMSEPSSRMSANWSTRCASVAAAAPAPAATDAQEVERLADVLDDDASDMDVFAQGSPRISMGGSSFADESKADDASSSLLESKDFQLHEGGHSDSDA